MLKTGTTVEDGRNELVTAGLSFKFLFNNSDSESDDSVSEDMEEPKEAAQPESKVKSENGESSTYVIAGQAVDGFNTFTTTTTLPAGLCILHDLGNGKYEAVNLENISLDKSSTITSTVQICFIC